MADPTILTFCYAYQNRHKYQKECSEDCYGLHVCRRWMGGCCREVNCPYGHSLQDEHNKRAIGRIKVLAFDLKICDDKTRFTIRKLFPATCFFYNYSKRSCNAGSTCDRLHVCADYVMGSCSNSSCPRSHKLLNDHNSSILYRFDVAVSGHREELIRVNILTAQSPEFEKTCNCSDCKKVKDENNFFLSSPVAIEHHSVDLEDDEISLSDFKETLSISSLLYAIAQAGGVETFDALALKFEFDNSFHLSRWFDQEKLSLKSPITIKPAQFMFENQQLVTIQHCLRTCNAYNVRGSCSDSRCPSIHVCTLFIAGLCPSSNSGTSGSSSLEGAAECTRHLSHKLEGNTFEALGIASQSVATKLKLVRAAHPVVCEKYNSPEGCHAGSEDKPACGKLHICNRMIVSTCTTCSLNHDFYNPMCMPLLKRLRLDTATDSILKLTTLPCNISDDERTTLYSTLANSKPHSTNDNTVSLPELPLASKFQLIPVRDVVQFCINNESSPCFATYEQLSQHFNTPSTFDWRAWCVYVRKPTASDYEAMHHYYLHPIAFDWRNKRYLTVTNAFRLCGFHQDARCSNRKCPRLHVCVRYIAGVCRDGEFCRLGHSTELKKCSVFEYIGLGAWTSERKANLIRAAHPIVCRRYAFATCDANTQCEQLHVCNQWILRTCSSCKLNHSLRNAHVSEVLQRYGMHEMNENAIRNLIIAVSDDKQEDEHKLQRNKAAVASLSAQLNCIQEQQVKFPAVSASTKRTPSDTNATGPHEVTIVKSVRQPVSDCDLLSESDSDYNVLLSQPEPKFKAPFPKAPASLTKIEQTPLSAAKSASELEPLTTTAKFEHSTFHTADSDDEQEPIRGGGASKWKKTVDDVKTVKEPFICERHLRGVCELDEVECSYFHLNQQFCWLFKLPSQSDGIVTAKAHDETYKSYIQQVAIRNSKQQKEIWYMFNDLLSEEIERCYVDPAQRSCKFFLNPDDVYPFAYTCELHFGTARDAAAFYLEARIKLSPSVNLDEQPRTTLPKRTNASAFAASPRQRFSMPQDSIAVRSVRTNSYAMLPAICLKATRWRWFYHARFKIDANGTLKYLDDADNSETAWLDLSKLVGTSYVDELEYQFVNGYKSYSVRTRIDKKRSITFEFDLEALLLRCTDETALIETELVSRPSLCHEDTLFRQGL